jgi:hypothetical protein
LALFGRRLVERAERLSLPASKNQHKCGLDTPLPIASGMCHGRRRARRVNATVHHVYRSVPDPA